MSARRQITIVAKAMAYARHYHARSTKHPCASPRAVWAWLTPSLKDYYRKHAAAFLKAS